MLRLECLYIIGSHSFCRNQIPNVHTSYSKGPLFHIYPTQGNRKLIGMTSGTGISGVLIYIRESNITSTVKCFPYLNKVNPQQTTFNGIENLFFLGEIHNLILSNFRFPWYIYAANILAYAQLRDNQHSKHSFRIQFLEDYLPFTKFYLYRYL